MGPILMSFIIRWGDRKPKWNTNGSVNTATVWCDEWLAVSSIHSLQLILWPRIIATLVKSDYRPGFKTLHDCHGCPLVNDQLIYNTKTVACLLECRATEPSIVSIDVTAPHKMPTHLDDYWIWLNNKNPARPISPVRNRSLWLVMSAFSGNLYLNWFLISSAWTRHWRRLHTTQMNDLMVMISSAHLFS